MSPRKPTPPPAHAPEPARMRRFNVHIHRIVEQTAVMAVLARSADEAEEAINRRLSDPDRQILADLEWGDGEIEQTESVVHVQEVPEDDDEGLSPVPLPGADSSPPSARKSKRRARAAVPRDDLEEALHDFDFEGDE